MLCANVCQRNRCQNATCRQRRIYLKSCSKHLDTRWAPAPVRVVKRWPFICPFNGKSDMWTQKPGDFCRVLGLCRSSEEELLTPPRAAADAHAPSSALGSADRSHVSVGKQKMKVKWNLSRSVNDFRLSSGAVQPRLCFLLVCHQETREPAASQCDRGDSCWKHVLPYVARQNSHLFFFFPSAGCFDKADGGSLWPPSWELQEPVWWFHRQIWNPDRRIPLIVRGAPHHLHSVASLLVWGADASRSVSLDSESVLSADSHTASPLLTPEPSLPSDCESCRTLALLGRLHNGPNSTQPETSSFLQSACFLYPNAIPKVWPSTTSKQASEKNIMFKTNVHWFPSVSGLHQDLWAPAGEGFREPAGRQTCLWSKNKVVKQ